MNTFWKGFAKQANLVPSRQQQSKQLRRDAESMDRSGKIFAGTTAAVGGAGALAAGLKKKPGLAIASGLLGLIGAANIPGPSRYGEGLRAHAKGVSGKKLSKSERDQLAMMNPSKSLLSHVHPAYRSSAAKHYSRLS